jgi:hypothetical protein
MTAWISAASTLVAFAAARMCALNCEGATPSAPGSALGSSVVRPGLFLLKSLYRGVSRLGVGKDHRNAVTVDESVRGPRAPHRYNITITTTSKADADRGH